MSSPRAEDLQEVRDAFPMFFEEARQKMAAQGTEAPAALGPVERFEVDLDAPPLERWGELIGAYKHKMQPARVYLREMLKLMEQQLASAGDAAPQGFTARLAAQQLCAAGHIDQEELRAVAELSGFDPEDLGLLQLAYEASARCSCVVANQPEGAPPLHARTLDWGALFLRELSVQVDFKRAGAVLYSAATWAGYLGVLTGCAQGRFAISVNYRSLEGCLIDNFKMGLQGGWPVGFLVRHVLQDPARFPDYGRAREHLAATPLMSPTYFVLTGCAPNEASSITRGREAEEPDKAQQLAAGPITMTNVDLRSDQQHRDTLQSSPRRVCAVYFLKERGDVFAGAASAWELLQRSPISNGITLYATVMCPATGAFETRVPLPCPLGATGDGIELVPREAPEEGLGGRAMAPGMAVVGTRDGYVGRPHYTQEQLLGMGREQAEAVLQQRFQAASPRGRAGSTAGQMDAEQWAAEWHQFRSGQEAGEAPDREQLRAQLEERLGSAGEEEAP